MFSSVVRNSQILPKNIQFKEPKLYQKLVKFKTIHDKPVELNAVYEDSLSDGSAKGTVVGFHGSPGSHNDFKYMRQTFEQQSIRFIGVNYPGFKNTKGYEGQNFVNEERQAFTNALLDELKIQGKVVYLGHSRGCENAIMTSVERNDPWCIGVILVNPPGLRPHQGVRPFWHIGLVDDICSTLPKFLGGYMVYKAVSMSGFKVEDSEDSFSTLKSARSLYFDKMAPFIEKFNKTPIKLLMTYGGKDKIIEKEVSEEYLDKYENIKKFSFEKDIDDSQKREIMEGFDGAKGAAVFVAENNHFQNKHQADLISFAINHILESTN